MTLDGLVTSAGFYAGFGGNVEVRYIQRVRLSLFQELPVIHLRPRLTILR